MLDKPNPLHPGIVLREIYMAEMGLNQTFLAALLKCSPRKINEIVNGKRGISSEFALELEAALKTPASMWVRMQAEYDLLKARQAAA